MKIECTSEQKEIIKQMIDKSSGRDCQKLLNIDPDKCMSFDDCRDCYEKTIEWTICDKEPEAPKPKDLLMSMNLHSRTFMEVGTLYLDKPMLLYNIEKKQWFTDVPNSTMIVFSPSKQTKDFIEQSFIVACKYNEQRDFTKYLWFDLPNDI